MNKNSRNFAKSEIINEKTTGLKDQVKEEHLHENEKEEDIKDVIYNQLNYECIRLFGLLLKFGLFNKNIFDKGQEDFEKIIVILVFILEFEEDYYRELLGKGAAAPLRRKYLEN